MRSRARPFVLLFLGTACAAPHPAPEPQRAAAEAQPADRSAPLDGRTKPAGETARAPRAPVLELPAGWETAPPARFERELERVAPSGTARRVTDSDLALLKEALRRGGDAGVRAAVLLARSADPRGRELFLGLLEERRTSPDDAASLVAARALGSAGEDASTGRASSAARLLELARGRGAHPRLEVRVECAASALLLGRDEALSALLDVLRLSAVTPVPAPVPSEAELGAAQRRAARAIEGRLGVPARYVPEASAEARTLEVTRLAELVAALARSRPAARTP